MNKVINISDKGQFTIPADVRKKLKIYGNEVKLKASFDEAKKILVLSKPTSK